MISPLRLALGKDGLDELDLDAVPPASSVNTWFFITITRENNIFTLYWNGSPMSSLMCSYDLDTDNTVELRIGGERLTIPVAPGYFNGLIDNVQIYNRALSES